MDERRFDFRLRSHHPGPDRISTDPTVELRGADGTWEPQQVNVTTPGFRLYLLSLLLCQHFYLVANAREKAIPLDQVEAEFMVTTRPDWILTAVEGDFRIRLDAAAEEEERKRADAGTIAWIGERMKLCPVSRNLPEGVRKHIGIRLVG